VALPPGVHIVEMEYRPLSVVAGLLLSALGVLIVASCGAAARWRGW